MTWRGSSRDLRLEPRSYLIGPLAAAVRSLPMRFPEDTRGFAKVCHVELLRFFLLCARVDSLFLASTFLFLMYYCV